MRSQEGPGAFAFAFRCWERKDFSPESSFPLTAIPSLFFSLSLNSRYSFPERVGGVSTLCVCSGLACSEYSPSVSQIKEKN